MRWPRPTVSMVLMARTPVSSGWRTGSRSIALIGAALHRFAAHALQRALAVDRLAMRVDHAAQQAVAHRQVQAAVLAAAPGVVLVAEARCRLRRRARRHARAAGQAVHLAGGHQEGAVAVEADHLGRDRVLAGRPHVAHRPTGTRTPAASSTSPVTRARVPTASSGCGRLA
jgi:hypothetical protein